MSGAQESASGERQLSIGDLIALNDEIAALARAGLPMERGLGAVGRDHRGRLGSAISRLTQRLEAGVSLGEALSEEKDQFPPVYCAVVEAGVRAGRLPTALENLAGFIRGYDESRRAIGLALWYPLIVLILAYSLFVFVLVHAIPKLAAAFESLEVPTSPVLGVLEQLADHVLVWGPILPAFLVLLAVVWTWSGKAANFQVRGFGAPVRWFPWMRSLILQFEAANFAQLLGILVEHGVPFPEAIRLAARSSGDVRLAQASASLADAVERGATGQEEGCRANGFPPLLRWLLANNWRQGSLPTALRQIAAIYRKRALRQAEKLRIILPTLLLISIGMTATLLYGLSLFLPLTSLLQGLTLPQAG